MGGYKDPAEEETLPLLPLQAGTVPCKSCSGEIPRFLHAQAQTLVCSCRRIYRNDHNGINYEGIFNNKKAPEPWIPPGSRGTLKGIKYQAVGYQIVKEKKKIYKWSEYVLFNPLHGYAFLSEYDGHWNFFRYIGDMPHNRLFEKSIEYKGYQYELFNKYTGESQFAKGKFPWDILGDQGQVWEYFSPPYSLNKKISNDEISWMHGEYLRPEALVWIYGRRKGAQAVAENKAFRFEGMIFSATGITVFLFLIFALAYLEEGLWDGLVWRERATFFSFFETLPAITDHTYLSLVVPLLAVPQVTHYVLDGFIWRVRKDIQLRKKGNYYTFCRQPKNGDLTKITVLHKQSYHYPPG